MEGDRDWENTKKTKQERRRKVWERVEKVREMQITSVARLGDSSRSHVPLLSPLDDPAPLCLHYEKGNGRRIYCWVLTCTHSWCCFSPLSPLAIPKASKTTGCQVVTAGFKQLLQQPWNQVPSLTTELCMCLFVSVCVQMVICVWGWVAKCLFGLCMLMYSCSVCIYHF